MRQESVLRLVDLVYAAACDPSVWPKFLHALSQAMDGSGADIAVLDSATSDTNIRTAVGILGSDFQKEYVGFVASDPWFVQAKARGLFQPGVIGLGEDLVPTRELERTDFYHQFGRRHDYYGGISAVVLANETSAATVSVCRRKDHAFGKPQVALMQALMPHLRRAMHVHHKLEEAEQRAAGLRATLNTLSAGAIVVGERGLVLFANDAARETLATRDGLTLDRGELRANRPRATAALRSLIKAAVDLGSAQGAGGGVLLLDRPSARRPLQVVVSALSTIEAAREPHRQAVVFLTDPERVPEPDVARLRRTYGLSRAEADVARHLLQDRSVREISETLSITVHTVRFHLKQLFSKTATTRQSELVRLLSSTLELRIHRVRF